ncbi:MAG TPA: GNAT family N-acetyltransferase [Alphaproteobacteria bacterium]|nr:N-acetyltransferase [Alphaproteobacteria bacterium]HOO50853.1 GNAT family N-acetyltransferase [Alphaproteobacteria bacterium]
MEFVNNIDQSRFEFHTETGAFAIANYHIAEKTLYIDYVESPPELRGTGAAGKLMNQIVEFAKEKNLSITPICGYAASWLRKNTK